MSLENIIISGEAGSGKDCVGTYLSSEYGYVRVAYGDEIKNEVLDAFLKKSPSLDLGYMNTRATKETPDPRLALVHCDDKDFVTVAMNVYQKEDQQLFDMLIKAHANGLNLGAVNDHQIVWDALHVYKNDANQFQDLCVSLRNTLPKQKYSVELDSFWRECRKNGNFSEQDRMSLPRSPRRITQCWGTEFRCHQDPKYWLNKIQYFIDASSDPVVVTDGRTHAELSNAHEKGMKRIHVENPFIEKKVTAHLSEQIPPPDSETFLIINDKFDDNFKSLHEKVEKALQKFGFQENQKSRKKSLSI